VVGPVGRGSRQRHGTEESPSGSQRHDNQRTDFESLEQLDHLRIGPGQKSVGFWTDIRDPPELSACLEVSGRHLADAVHGPDQHLPYQGLSTGVGMGDFDALVLALTPDHDNGKVGQSGNRTSGNDPNRGLVTPRLV
jgi:hypothetical protein